MLSVHGIHKAYGDKHALRGVSLDVAAGEIFGLLGPNGAGKTSLIRIVMDVIRADAGSIALFGTTPTRASFDRVAYLPEQLGLYRRRRVLDAMTYLAELKGIGRGDARGRARTCLDRMGLAGCADWRVERLSKGMAQKIQIAAALLPDPDLCVLDEPFSGLDPVNAEWVAEELRARRSAGKSVILSTHEITKAESLCDRIGLIHRGELVLYGDVSDVRRRFSGSMVEVDLEGGRLDAPGIALARRIGSTAWRITLAPDARPSDVLADLIRAGAKIGRFEPVVASLEHVFMMVIGRKEDTCGCNESGR